MGIGVQSSDRLADWQTYWGMELKVFHYSLLLSRAVRLVVLRAGSHQ